MPDSISGISGLRPVVRRVSVTQKDLINRFERSGSSTSSSVSNSGSNTPTSLVSRSRAGSLKKTSAPKSPKTSTTDSTAVTPRVKTERERQMEENVLHWIEQVIHKRPDSDYESFIRDAVILSEVMTSIVFNSVPKEDITESWGSNAAKERTRALIREMTRYGVRDVFEPEDLIELKNIPKVTKCVDELARLASRDKDCLLASTI